MEMITLNQAVFYFLGAVIIVCSILTVTTRRILRAATYLLFVLFATAGIYFQLNYSFLGAVQLTIYAGGIIVLYVFSILLTSNQSETVARLKRSRMLAALIASLAGTAICVWITLMHTFPVSRLTDVETPQAVIGFTLMGTGKYQYILPFELISILLLACIVGGIMIARKR